MALLLQIIRRCPLTLLMAGTLLFGGLISNSLFSPLEESWCGRWGCSPAMLHRGDWHRLFTSLVFTAGAAKFQLSFVMLCGCVGSTEYLFGTLRTALTFFGVHVATLLILLTAISLSAAAGSNWGEQLLHACDVGPSAGYYGCLGLLVATRRSWLRVSLLFLVGAVLVARAGVSTWWLPESVQSLSADLAHLIAFPAGCLNSLWRVRPSRQEQSDDDSRDGTEGISA